MVSYDFYLDNYFGTSIPDEEWDLFEKRAEETLRRFQRTYSVTPFVTDGEKMAVCAMADALAYFTAAQNGAGGAVSSASIGSVSVSYQNKDAVDLSPKGQERELLRCARQYLDIYRGVGRC